MDSRCHADLSSSEGCSENLSSVQRCLEEVPCLDTCRHINQNNRELQGSEQAIPDGGVQGGTANKPGLAGPQNTASVTSSRLMLGTAPPNGPESKTAYGEALP